MHLAKHHSFTSAEPAATPETRDSEKWSAQMPGLPDTAEGKRRTAVHQTRQRSHSSYHLPLTPNRHRSRDDMSNSTPRNCTGHSKPAGGLHRERGRPVACCSPLPLPWPLALCPVGGLAAPCAVTCMHLSWLWAARATSGQIKWAQRRNPSCSDCKPRARSTAGEAHLLPSKQNMAWWLSVYCSEDHLWVTGTQLAMTRAELCCAKLPS